MTSTFDTNAWYNILWQGESPYTMAAFDPNDSGTGAVTETTVSSVNANQSLWQFLPLGPTNTYVLRNNYLGTLWYLSTFWNPNNTAADTQTHLNIEKFYTVDSVANRAQWVVRPSNGTDEMYYFSAVRNSTSIDLSFKSGAAYLTDPATVTAVGAFDWSISKAGTINDVQWSTSVTGTASATSSSSTSNTTSTATTTSSSLSGASTPAGKGSNSGTPVGAIAGGVVGGLVLLLVLVGALIFWLRRRKRGHSGKAQGNYAYPNFKPELADTPQGSPGHDSSVNGPRAFYGRKPSKGQPGIYEKPASSDGRQMWPTAELPGESRVWDD